MSDVYSCIMDAADPIIQLVTRSRGYYTSLSSDVLTRALITAGDLNAFIAYDSIA